MANRRFNRFLETLHKEAVIIDCNFTVDQANGNGFGARSLKGAGVLRAFMHSTAAITGTTHSSILIDGIAGGTSSLRVGMPIQGSGIPAGAKITAIVDSGSINIFPAATTSTTGSFTYQAIGNPNPAPGVILIALQDCYNYYIGGFSGQVSPSTGGLLTSGLTVGVPYTIAVLGASTLAQWQAAGVPVGITPAVGVVFIAQATSVAGGGSVIASGVSGIDHIEALGDPNKTLISNAGPKGQILGVQSNAYLVFQCLAAGVRTAPADNTVIGMAFYMSNSSIIVKGY